MWHLQGDTVLEDTQKYSNGYTAKGSHGCGIDGLENTVLLGENRWGKENGWAKGQEWVFSEKGIRGNTKWWTDLKNQQNLITRCCGMWERGT